MPYYKVYSRKLYDADIKYLLLKIKYEKDIDTKILKLIYNSNNISIIYEIVIGIISTLIDRTEIKCKEIGDGLYAVGSVVYKKVVTDIFDVDFYYTLVGLSRIRNNASHSLSESIKDFKSELLDLGLINLIKMVLTLYKKAGIGRELATCIYEMFKDDIDIRELFESEMQYKIFDSLLMPAQRENLFESAVDFLLV